MSITENLGSVAFGISADLTIWMRGVFSLFAPKRASRHIQQRMLEDLIRLAETSPHLLDDIGFIEDEAASVHAQMTLVLGGRKLKFLRVD